MTITESDREKARDLCSTLMSLPSDTGEGVCPKCKAIAALIAQERERPYWVCEQHPDMDWPHDDCAGPGMLRSDALRLIGRYKKALSRIRKNVTTWPSHVTGPREALLEIDAIARKVLE